jgi:uncharacterized protein YwqG
MRELGIQFTKYQRKLYPENLGERSKLGGEPEWIQEEENIKCPICKRKMSFIGQIDSIDYGKNVNKDNDQQLYIFGDVGMIYIFFCFDCLKPKSIFQSY